MKGRDTTRAPVPVPAAGAAESSAIDSAQLIARAAAGDAAAWRGLIDRFSGQIFGFVRAQCGDPELAEEITQSTFATVAAKLPGYVEQGAFESWLVRIAMNRLRDEMRRRKRHAVAMEGGTLADLAPRPAQTRAGVEPAVRATLAEAIASLGKSDREVISLRHVGGMSFQQLADTLEEPLGTLLARHHRALRKLREFLIARGIDGI
jgi:RNA polymerase sigma-70 factor (ECF subfamily)